jgi:two-component system cell cycle response regulator CpdR
MSQQLTVGAVLVVDDDPAIREILEMTLEEAGFQPVLVPDDAQALRALEGNSAGELVGLITDIDLRGSKTGWDIAKRAREINPNLPVVYISGDSGHEWSAYGVPQSAMIAKPFAPAQIIVALASLLNQTEQGS